MISSNKNTELHLLEYRKRMLEYVQIARPIRITPFEIGPPEEFPAPDDIGGYANAPISDDLITDVFLEFSNKTRKQESERYLRSLTGIDDSCRFITSHVKMFSR
jgi:hypothetical protein